MSMVLCMSTSKNKTYPASVELERFAVHQRLVLETDICNAKFWLNLARSAIDKPTVLSNTLFSYNLASTFVSQHTFCLPSICISSTTMVPPQSPVTHLTHLTFAFLPLHCSIFFSQNISNLCSCSILFPLLSTPLQK